MRNALLYGLFAATIVTAPAQAQSLTDFFRSANLDPLAKGSTVLNLEAQSSSKTPQSDVNVFDDYFLIAGDCQRPPASVVNFDRQLQNKGEKTIGCWIGVAQYSNHAISADLQDGFQKVIANYKMPNAKAAHVAIYKTLNTGQLVYDYAIPRGARCQEYLYVPATGDFQLGMSTSCYWTVQGFKRPAASAAGHRK